MFGLGADKSNIVLFENFGETGVFRQETVAGMDGIGPGDFAGGQKGWNIQIGITRRRRPDAHRFIRKLDVHGIGIGGGMHGDCGNAQFLGGTQDAQRDFPSVGDEDLVEHLLINLCFN